MELKNFRLKTVLIILLVFIFVRGIEILPVSAQPLSYYLNLARKHSPVLKAATFAAQANQNQSWAQSIFPANPELTLSHQNIPINTWPSTNKSAMSGISVGLSQAVGFPWESYWRKKYSRLQYSASKEQVEWVKRNLALQISLLYQKIYFQAYKIQIQKERKEALVKILQLARSLVSVNKMNSSQLLKLQADLLAADNQILILKSDLQQWQHKMQALTGKQIAWQLDTKQIKIWLQKKPWLKKELTLAVFNWQEHPIFRLALLQEKKQKTNFSLQKAKLIPLVKLAANYTIRQEISNASTGEDFFSIKATIPIPLYYSFKDRYQIKAKEKLWLSSRQQSINSKIQLLSSWNSEKQTFQKLLKAFQLYQNQILSNYKAVYQSQLASLPSGTISLIDVLDSYQKYLKAMDYSAYLYTQLRNSYYRLQFLLYPAFQ